MQKKVYVRCCVSEKCPLRGELHFKSATYAGPNKIAREIAYCSEHRAFKAVLHSAILRPAKSASICFGDITPRLTPLSVFHVFLATITGLDHHQKYLISQFNSCLKQTDLRRSLNQFSRKIQNNSYNSLSSPKQMFEVITESFTYFKMHA